MDIQFDIECWLLKRAEKIRRQIISGEISESEVEADLPEAFIYEFDDEVFPLLLQKENDVKGLGHGLSISKYINEAKNRGYSALKGYPTIVSGQYVCVFEKENRSFIMEDISGQWYLFSSYCTSPDCADFEYERWAVDLTPEQMFCFLDKYITLSEIAVEKWKEFYWAQEDCRCEVKKRRQSIEIICRTLDEQLGKELVGMAIHCNIYHDDREFRLCAQIGEEVLCGIVSLDNVGQVLSILESGDIESQKESLEKMGYCLFPLDSNHTLSFAEYKRRIKRLF